MSFYITSILLMLCGAICSVVDVGMSAGFWIASGCFAIAEYINDLQKFNNTIKKEVKSK